jgi:hypothetical protein
MGAQPLHHSVEAKWVLRGRYLQMHTTALDDSAYEALYHLGRNDEDDLYAFHLIDTTGVYVRPRDVVGLGRRDGDSILFSFGGDDEPFLNRLTRHEEDDAWSWDLSYLRDGKTVAFATKRMVRTSG